MKMTMKHFPTTRLQGQESNIFKYGLNLYRTFTLPSTNWDRDLWTLKTDGGCKIKFEWKD
jgi:hypothetical protein